MGWHTGTRTITMSRWLSRWPFSRAWPEADDELTDRETVVIELMDGQYSNPVGSLPSIRPRTGWLDVSRRRGATTNIGPARPGQLPYRYEARPASQSFPDCRVYPNRFFRAH